MTKECSLCGISHKVKSIYIREGLAYRKCMSCGHFEQIIDGESTADKFEDEQQKYYSSLSQIILPESPFFEREQLRARKKVVAKMSGCGGSVIEVGPGNGAFLKWLQEQGCAVVAVEHSYTLSEQLRSKLGVMVIEGEFEKIDLPEESFDALFSFHVIEHVPNACAHLEKAYRVVKAGGYALIATPNAESWQHKIPGCLSPNFDSSHLRIFSPMSLGRLCRNTGWTIMRLQTPEYSSSWLRVVSKIVRRCRGEDEERTAGKYVSKKSISTTLALNMFKWGTGPIRCLQAFLGCGNELFLALRKEPTKSSARLEACF